jgi:hypothetical protein
MTAKLLGVHEEDPPGVVAERYPGHAWGAGFVSDDGRPLPEDTTAEQLVGMVAAKARPHLAAGHGCIVRVKTPMRSVGRGLWDDRLTPVGEASRGQNLKIILCHEPEDDMPASTFVPGFNRGREALRRGNPELEVMYAGMAYQWRPGSRTTADGKAWAADLVADRYLIDVYFGNNFRSEYTIGEHPGFHRWHDHMIAPYPGRRWGLGEWGRRKVAGRAAHLAADFEWLANDPIGQACTVLTLWGTVGVEKNPAWLLTDAEREVIRAGFARLAGPAGFRPSTLDGLVVCETCGCAVADDLTNRHTHE